MRILLLSLATTSFARPLTDLDHRNLVGPYALDASTDCAMRNLSYGYALHLLPSRAPLLDVFDALRLALDCNLTRPSALGVPPAPFYAIGATRAGSGARTILRTLPVQAGAFFVDAARGSDSSSGTEAAPFATPARALAATRAAGGGGQIVLRGGAPFDLPEPLLLTPQDSGLALSAYPGEAPVLSGGAHLAPLTWALVGPAPGPAPSPPLSPPAVGTLLLLPSGAPCVAAPGQSNPGTCVPFGQLGSGAPANASLCASACARSAACTAYTYHTAAAGAWAQWCYFRVDAGGTLAPSDAAAVSGAKPPPPPPSSSVTIWRADLALAAQQGLRLPFGALFAPSGRRATRARFPNGNPETDQEPNGYTKAQSWAPPPPYNQSSLVQSNPLFDPTTRGVCPMDACREGGPHGIGPPWAIFCCFFWGWNATAVNFSTGSFWAVQPGPPGGGTARMPGGMVAGDDLAPRLAAWSRPRDALVHAFHGAYWGDWAWTVQSVNASSGAFAFERGGWQEARGAGGGDSMYVENVREELDAAGEWYVDADARVLYVAVNGTAAPASAGWVAGQLNNLITIAGTPAAPVEGISIAGLTLEFSEPTFMEEFTVAGGGDWSFHDGGALRLSGTRNCSVVGSLFVNLGGTGVMVSGWNRGARVEDSEFKWLGESAIVSAGLSGDQFDQSAPGVPYGEGMRVARNLGHELGLYVKQTGFYYQGMTANASIVENVFFNGPRAGVNVNDGAFGGHDISRNVGFNMVVRSGGGGAGGRGLVVCFGAPALNYTHTKHSHAQYATPCSPHLPLAARNIGPWR